MRKLLLLAAVAVLAAVLALAWLQTRSPPQQPVGSALPDAAAGEAPVAATAPEQNAASGPDDRFISCPGHPRCPKQQESKGD